MYIGIEIETSWCSSGIGSLESLISGSDSWLSDADNWFSNDNVWFMQTEEDHIPTLVNKSDTDIIIITPTLRTAKDEDYTVEITITGGQSQVEDKGVGKHYTVAFEGGAELGETIVNTAYNTTVVTAIIPASETSRTITLTVVNNTVLEFDRTITVVAPLFGKKSFTIVDDNANSLGVVNAVTAGLVANDEDSAQANKEVFDAIIAAFKATEGYDKNTDQGIIYIPNGTYYVLHGQYYWPGISFVGESRNGVTLKRPSEAWMTANGYETRYHLEEDIVEADLNYTNDTIQLDTETWPNDLGVKFTGGTGKVLPGGLNSTSTYYLYHQGSSLYKVSSTSGGAGATINLTDPGASNVVTSVYTPTKGYWMFGLATTGDYWNGEADSPPCGFRRMTFDGSYDEYVLEYYTKYEQSQFIKGTVKDLDAEENPTEDGRATIIFEDLQFDNNITGNFGALDNTLSRYYHINHSNTSVYGKGDWSIVGGNCELVAADVVGYRQVDFEQNADDGGHHADGRIDITIDNCSAPSLTIGLKDASGDQTVDINDCEFGNFSINAPACTVRFDGGSYTPTAYGSLNNTYLYDVDSFEATGCDITINPRAAADWHTGIPWAAIAHDKKWRFYQCNFIAQGDFGSYEARCFSNSTSSTTNVGVDNNEGTLELEECSFSGFDWILYLAAGGKVKIINPVIKDCTRLVYLLGTTEDYKYSFEAVGTAEENFGGDDCALTTYMRTYATSTVVPGNLITHTNVQLPVTNSRIEAAGPAFMATTFSGKRTIIGSEAPSTSVTGLPGDEYYNSVTEAYYDCPAQDTEEFAHDSGKVDTVNDKFVTLTNTYASGYPVRVTSTGTRPEIASAQMSANFYKTKNAAAGEIQLSVFAGSATLNITGTGTGTHTLYSTFGGYIDYDSGDTVQNTLWSPR